MNNSIIFNVFQDSQETNVKECANVLQHKNIEHHEIHDISLIQCFWGNDIERLKASVEAIEKNIKTIPRNWIFVEAQRKGESKCFEWVRKYGAKYKFVTIPQKGQWLFIKNALWNIGYSMTRTKKLCFADSDVFFENPNWTVEASEKLEKCDVISLSETVTYNGFVNIETIGSAIEKSGDRLLNFGQKHTGFTFGITRKAFEQFGRLDMTSCLDDQWMWRRIVGKTQNDSMFTLPYVPGKDMDDGFPFSVGCVGGRVIHISHGTENTAIYENMSTVVRTHTTVPYEDITYEKGKDLLPVWSGSSVSNVIRNTLEEMTSVHPSSPSDIYQKFAIQEFGAIDEDNPLVVVTVWRKNFKNCDQTSVLKLKQNLETSLKNDFTFVCFSTEDIPGVDVIIYKDSTRSDFEIVTDESVIYPENSNILMLPLNTKIPDGTELSRSEDEMAESYSNKYALPGIIYFKYTNQQKHDKRKGKHKLRDSGKGMEVQNSV